MTLTTVKDYCLERGVSRQFVHEYVRKGKFTIIELPYFVELNGKKHNIGKQKFLEIPDNFSVEQKPYWSGDISDNDYAEQLASDATEDFELRKFLTQLLKIEDEDTRFKSHLMNNIFPIGNPKRNELEIAFQNCTNLMKAELMDIAEQVNRLKTKVNNKNLKLN